MMPTICPRSIKLPALGRKSLYASTAPLSRLPCSLPAADLLQKSTSQAFRVGESAFIPERTSQRERTRKNEPERTNDAIPT